MRVLVCGGRDCDGALVWNWLERHLKNELQFIKRPVNIDCIIHGGARGADDGAGRWGESEHVKVHVFTANWKKYGNAAGPIRNQRMIDQGKPDVVVAFPGGKGTADMVSRAESVGIRIIRAELP